MIFMHKYLFFSTNYNIDKYIISFEDDSDAIDFARNFRAVCYRLERAKAIKIYDFEDCFIYEPVIDEDDDDPFDSLDYNLDDDE